jgi:DNA processing protein
VAAVIDHRYFLPLLYHRLPAIQQRQLRALLANNLDDDDSNFSLLTAEQQSQRHKPSAELLAQIERDLHWLDTHQATLINYRDSGYPSLLLEIADPPPLLYVLGDVTLLSSVQIGVVGSRKPSRGGCEHAHGFAKQLAVDGWTITSGMALGIDAEAHRGALDAGGKTIAVLGTGLDVPYPNRHRNLYQQIAEHGAVISEWPLGSPPLPGHFPRRNRIISGLSLGVLVVEAALQSGSLVTARLALEQNREVFAIPGSIHNPAVKGCHELIRQGAKLVEHVGHIEEELSGWLAPTTLACNAIEGAMDDSPSFKNMDPLTKSEQSLLKALGFEPASVDELIGRSIAPINQMLADITTLIAKGLLDEREGRYWRLR